MREREREKVIKVGGRMFFLHNVTKIGGKELWESSSIRDGEKFSGSEKGEGEGGRKNAREREREKREERKEKGYSTIWSIYNNENCLKMRWLFLKSLLSSSSGRKIRQENLFCFNLNPRLLHTRVAHYADFCESSKLWSIFNLHIILHKSCMKVLLL